MKKIAIVVIVILLVLGVGFFAIPKNNENELIDNNVSGELSGEVSVDISGEEIEQIPNEDEYYDVNTWTEMEWDTMWNILSKYEIDENKAKELNNNVWLSGDEIDSVDYFKDLDYTKISRKDTEKELIYTTNFKYIFQGSPCEEIIPVINIASDDAEELNEIIKFSLTDYYSIDYSVNIENDILTLIIYGDAEELPAYSLYKINIYTGEEVK
ncbi:MAG: hypothetical protein IJO08_01190 [Clostridia bacterium]|nr:hypothetical protein [Clostridia bacterium]